MKFASVIVFMTSVLCCQSVRAEIEDSFSFPKDSLASYDHWSCCQESWWWPWGDDEDKDSKPAMHPFDSSQLVGLEKKLQQKIMGQNEAIRLTVNALNRYACGLNREGPVASLLYVGPTGVGKTQLVKELARELFGSKPALLRLNMGEYDDRQIMNLIGPPRGYAGHEEGGRLINFLIENPISIVLLDQLEKAHPDVLKIFLSVFEEGMIEDPRGSSVDCRNVLFIATSNVGADKILNMHDLGYDNKKILEGIKPTLMNALSPEFYNRLETVIFRGLHADTLEALPGKLLVDATEILTTHYQISLDFSPDLIQFLRHHAAGDYASGARPMQQFIQRTVVTALTEAIQKGCFYIGDCAHIDYQNETLIIANKTQGTRFIFEMEEENHTGYSPFKLENMLKLNAKLRSKILGQPLAIEQTVDALIRYSAGLTRNNAPIGAFLYVGPTGVGKTELAKELARELVGGVEHLIRIDMSEYSEPHNVARLIGAPPGYLGYQEGGQLTEALKKHPYAIVVLDEIEKADPHVLKLFLSVFDEGRITSAKGEVIDCRNVIFIATTNLTAAKILKMQQQGYVETVIIDKIQPDLIKAISPELYNRLEIALFLGLDDSLIDHLIQKMLCEVQTELQHKRNIEIHCDASLLQVLRVKGFDYQLGARPLRRTIEQLVVTPIAKEIVQGNISSGDTVMLFYENGTVQIVRRD